MKAWRLRIALLVLLVAALSIVVRLSRAGAPIEKAPRMLLLVEAPQGPAVDTTLEGGPLAVAALSKPQQNALAGELLELRDRVQIARSPLVEDLRSDTLEQAMHAVVERYKSRSTVANSLSKREWRDESVGVRRVAVCPTGALCFDPFERVGSSDQERRARALVWVWSHAAILVLPDKASLRTAHLLLQEQAQALPSMLAAVYSADAFAPVSPEIVESARALNSELRSLSSRITPTPERAWLEAIAEGAQASTPIALRPNELLLLPRVSALARAGDVQREVETCLNEHAMTATWGVAPVR